MFTPLLLYAEFFDFLEGKLTAGYSETYSEGQTSGVTVTADPGQHATVTWGGRCSCNIDHHDFVQLQHLLFCVVAVSNCSICYAVLWLQNNC